MCTPDYAVYVPFLTVVGVCEGQTAHSLAPARFADFSGQVQRGDGPAECCIQGLDGYPARHWPDPLGLALIPVSGSRRQTP